MRFIIDMNLSPRWVAAFRDAGFEATHWSSIGAADAPDLVIMDYAAAHDAVILTHDLDFGAILAAKRAQKPSVIQIRSDDINPDAIGPQVIQAVRQLAVDLELGALVTIEPSRARLRVLPPR